MNCPTFETLNRYHDGELSPAEALVIASHVSDCAACAEMLTSLQQVSQTVAAASMPAVDVATQSRWLTTLRRSQDRSVLRLATMLTAAAAMVLLAVTLWRPAEHQSSPGIVMNEWETTMLVRDEPEAPSASLAAASWMAADLSAQSPGAQWH
jgi:anti-sigma factor RsiW